MAAKEKKKGRMYQFEISRGGLVVMGLGTLGVLLWMFVFGVWVGRDLSTGSKFELTPGPPLVAGEPERAGPPAAIRSPVELPSPEVPGGAATPQNDVLSQTGVPGSHPLPGSEDGAEVEPEHETASGERPKVARQRFFTLQIASVRDAGQAAALKSFWDKKGYEVYVVGSEVPKRGMWYRVQIGRFDTVEEANKVAVQIAQAEKTRAYITTVSVTGPPSGPVGGAQ